LADVSGGYFCYSDEVDLMEGIASVSKVMPCICGYRPYEPGIDRIGRLK
jgi:hypothetical protein